MVVILVILHQHSLAGSIMGLLDLDWYSRLLLVKFALLSHSDLLCFGLPGCQPAIETFWCGGGYLQDITLIQLGWVLILDLD